MFLREDRDRPGGRIHKGGRSGGVLLLLRRILVGVVRRRVWRRRVIGELLMLLFLIFMTGKHVDVNWGMEGADL
jgi:hypothetical protein